MYATRVFPVSNPTVMFRLCIHIIVRRMPVVPLRCHGLKEIKKSSRKFFPGYLALIHPPVVLLVAQVLKSFP